MILFVLPQCAGIIDKCHTWGLQFKILYHSHWLFTFIKLSLLICKNPWKEDTVVALRCFQVLATLAPFYNMDTPERLERYRHMVTVCGTGLKLRPRVQRSHFIINSCAKRSPNCHDRWLNGEIVNHVQNLMISLCRWTNLLVFPFPTESSEVAQCVEASSPSLEPHFP